MFASIGGYKGDAGMPPPPPHPRPKFLQNCMLAPPRELAPQPRENPGSATALCHAPTRLPTLALKHYGHITRNSKQRCQWPYKKDLCPPPIKKKHFLTVGHHVRPVCTLRYSLYLQQFTLTFLWYNHWRIYIRQFLYTPRTRIALSSLGFEKHLCRI